MQKKTRRNVCVIHNNFKYGIEIVNKNFCLIFMLNWKFKDLL